MDNIGYIDTHCNIPNILEKFQLKPTPIDYNNLKANHFPKEFEGEQQNFTEI